MDERKPAKNIAQDRHDSIDLLSDEEECLPQDDNEHSPSGDSGVQRQAAERFTPRGPQKADAAKAQGSSGKTQGGKKANDQPVTKKKTQQAPRPSNADKYKNKSK